METSIYIIINTSVCPHLTHVAVANGGDVLFTASQKGHLTNKLPDGYATCFYINKI